jgi:hypothetical protein
MTLYCVKNDVQNVKFDGDSSMHDVNNPKFDVFELNSNRKRLICKISEGIIKRLKP